MRFTGRRVYLTGGTGFIGGALARRLVEEGADLTCLVRPGTDASDLERLGARVQRGNVTEPQTLDLGGQHLAIHAAAWVGFGIPERKVPLFRRTNVEGTRNLLHAAEKAGVAKVVHVSSVAALGENGAGASQPLTEDAVRERAYRSEYERTKTESHLLVAHAPLPHALPMPGLVVGPGGPFDWLVRGLAKGRLPALPADDAVKGWVHVEDVVEGVLQCATRGHGPFVLVDENARLTELFVAALEEAGLRVPRRRVPTAALLAGAGLVEGAFTLARRTPPVSRELVSKLRVPMTYDASRARKELGWRPDLVPRLARDLQRAAVA